MPNIEKINKLRSTCEILREINDLHQGDSELDIITRDKVAETTFKSKKMAKKLKEYNKQYCAGWWKENADFEADLERRMSMDYVSADRKIIVIVLGFHKSGTSLLAKALHAAGVNMHPATKDTDYKSEKYEDPEFAAINHMILGRSNKRHSLEIPTVKNDNDEVREAIQEYLKKKKGSWGAKMPDATLTYDVWRKYLPLHYAIGIYRPLLFVANHYAKKANFHYPSVIGAWDYYNSKLLSYNIPIFHYSDILQNGFENIEDYLSIKLPDVRIEGKTEGMI